MQSTRMWSLAAVVIIMAVLAGSWFVGISPKLQEASAANAERSNVEAQNAIHQAKVTALKVQAEQLEELQEELEGLQRSVPDRANLSELIGQVSAMAARWGVEISQFTAGDPVVFLAPTEASAIPEISTAQSGVVPDTFLTVAVGINLEGDYDSIMGFVNQLQQGERLFLVHGLSLARDKAAEGNTVEYSLTGQIFALMDTPPAAADGEVEAVNAAE